MPPAARVGDQTGHPGTIGPPIPLPSVFIGGGPAITVGTPHICTMPPPAGPHGVEAITGPCSSTVFIDGKPAARVGDLAVAAPILGPGCPTVLIGG
ncbi:PAAR domain-containing protein [Mycobacterium sp. Y57]|nr:PAAR domain-containing protein [Mycolicibacterium xanthum]